MPEMAEKLAKELRAALPGVLRRVGRDRPALSPAGRSGHAVVHHGRRRLDEGRHGDDPRSRHAQAGARRGRPAARRSSRSGSRREGTDAGPAPPRRRGDDRGALARVLRVGRGAQGDRGAAADLREVPARARRRGARARARGVRGRRRGERGAARRRGCCSTGRWRRESVARARAARRARDRVGGDGGGPARRTAARCRTSRSSIEIAQQHRPRERLALERARAAHRGEAELAPMRRERFQRETRHSPTGSASRRATSPTFELLCGVDLRALAAQCEAVPARHAGDVGRRRCREFVRRELGIPLSEATRADALALMRAREFDAFFPATRMEASIAAEVSEMGIDADRRRARRARHRRPGREARRARSARRCAIPDEVYLVLRPHGGQTDYTTFLHELGHALHFGIHARATSRSSIAGSATTRSPRATRCSSTTCMQNAGLAAALHRAREEANCRPSCAPRASRSCSSCAATARSSSTRSSCTAARTSWDSLPDLYVELAHRRRRPSATIAPTRSSTWTRASTRRAICARGSCRR